MNHQKQSNSNQKLGQKVKATIFWDSKYVLIRDQIENATTVTGVYYADVSSKLSYPLIKSKKGNLMVGAMIHHDNVCAHSLRVAQDVL